MLLLPSFALAHRVDCILLRNLYHMLKAFIT